MALNEVTGLFKGGYLSQMYREMSFWYASEDDLWFQMTIKTYCSGFCSCTNSSKIKVAICKRTCLGYWDFPLDELEAFWLKFSWLCKMCRKAESIIILRSNPNFYIQQEVDHAAAAVVVCSLSPCDGVVWVVATSPKSPAREWWPFHFLPSDLPTETSPQHWCGCFWIFHTKGSPPCSPTVTLRYKHLCPASWV